MDYPTVSVRWSAPIPLSGADASPLPGRGGVYEILIADGMGVERSFVGQCDDLRRAYISHIGGSKGSSGLRSSMAKHDTAFRYWEQENRARRWEVLAALIDLHCYDWGHDEPTEAISCINLNETE